MHLKQYFFIQSLAVVSSWPCQWLCAWCGRKCTGCCTFCPSLGKNNPITSTVLNGGVYTELHRKCACACAYILSLCHPQLCGKAIYFAHSLKHIGLGALVHLYTCTMQGGSLSRTLVTQTFIHLHMHMSVHERVKKCEIKWDKVANIKKSLTWNEWSWIHNITLTLMYTDVNRPQYMSLVTLNSAKAMPVTIIQHSLNHPNIK